MISLRLYWYNLAWFFYKISFGTLDSFVSIRSGRRYSMSFLPSFKVLLFFSEQKPFAVYPILWHLLLPLHSLEVSCPSPIPVFKSFHLSLASPLSMKLILLSSCPNNVVNYPQRREEDMNHWRNTQLIFSAKFSNCMVHCLEMTICSLSYGWRVYQFELKCRLQTSNIKYSSSILYCRSKR